ncbi:MAG TPA: DUF222 domain-containing protein [Kribbella sp.]
MFEGDLEELSTVDLLSTASEFGQIQDRAGVRVLEAALVFADRNAMVEGEPLPGYERIQVYGGEGCPGVAEFAPIEFGAVMRMSSGAASALIGEALALRHRLPRIWAAVLAGNAVPWRARKVAHACLSLSLEAAALVDKRVVRIVNTVTPGALKKIITAAVWEADPDLAKAQAEAAAKARGVFVAPSDDHGTKRFWVRAAAGDVIRFDATVDDLARALKTLGDTDTLDERRAKAIGWISDPAAAHQLLEVARHLARTHPTHPQPTTTNPQPEPEPRRAGPPRPEPEPRRAGPPQPEPPRSEPSQPEPRRAGPPRPEPPRSEPSQPQLPQPEPSQPGPRQSEALESEALESEPSQPEPRRAGPPQPEPAQSEPPQPELPQPEPRCAESPQPEPPRSEPSEPQLPRPEPRRAEPPRPEPPRSEPSEPQLPQPEPRRAGPPRPELPRTEPSQPGVPQPEPPQSEAVPADALLVMAFDRGEGGDEVRGDFTEGASGRWAEPGFEDEFAGDGSAASGRATDADAFTRRMLAGELPARLAAIKQEAYRSGLGAGPSGRGQPRHTVYVHLTDRTLATGNGVLRVEELGPLLATQLTELLGHDQVVVKPVIDLHDQVSVHSYEIPDRIRERVRLRHPVDMFPYGAAEATRRMDQDHITPYNRTGPPAEVRQTGTHNLIPLSRLHHRAKTFGGWRNRRLPTGAVEWTSPHGFTFIVDHTGTQPARRSPAEPEVDTAGRQ